MECEFEEKQYEELLNCELAFRGRIYPAGQVLENTIGIDAAVFSKDPAFLRLWNSTRWWWLFGPIWKHGVSLSRELWDDAEKKLDSVDFPKFLCNVFIQHKRPEYIASRLGKEYSYWKKKYFRYDISVSQRDILIRLEQRISKNSIVVYACPAFSKLEELWNFNERSTLVENSNFVEPHILLNHQRYTFVNGGKEGQAFSKPTHTEGIELLTEINRIRERGLKFKTNAEFIDALAHAIRETMETSEVRIKKTYFSIIERIGLTDHLLAKNLTEIFAFVFLTNITWTIGL